MNTKSIPMIVMLIAGFLTCVIQIINGVDTFQFMKTLLIVLICFYILGSIIKVILDKNFINMGIAAELTQEQEKAQDTKEETDSAKEQNTNSAESTEEVPLKETAPEEVE